MLLFDGNDPERQEVSGLVLWARCGSQENGYHLLCKLTMGQLSDEEITAFQNNVRDRVAGVSRLQLDSTYSDGTQFVMTVTAGNATPMGARSVLERLGEQLGLELTIRDEENKRLHAAFITASILGALDLTGPSDLFGYGFYDPYGQWRRGSQWPWGGPLF